MPSSAAPNRAPIALTCGDPGGIGPEITLTAWEALRGEVPFFVIGDATFYSGFGRPVAQIATPADLPADALPVLNLPFAADVTAGSPTAANAPAIIGAIETAVALTQTGAASAICTNPINKKLLYDGAGFAYPGHTEFLAALGGAGRSFMMLAGPDLRVVPVTIHIALEAVKEALTPELLRDTIRATHHALQTDFGIPEPRIAVAGLNPHAGEGGAMGQEEITLIAPCLEALRAEGIAVAGPLPADTMFHARARAAYDAAVCMYHDQALIPIKALNFDDGVNVTLGLPFIRTSPDHGTAYDIAGKGIARADSLIAALRMAWDMSGRRGDA